jgi:tRNA(Arg) A34 adenosine deaminase TadA
MDQKIMDLAIMMARRNDITGLSKHAAICVNHMTGRVVSIGYNKRKTHPLAAQFSKKPDSNIYLHAEIDAIRLAIRNTRTSADFRDCDLYVARVLKDGTVANSKPCSGCERAIVHFGFHAVYWS